MERPVIPMFVKLLGMGVSYYYEYIHVMLTDKVETFSANLTYLVTCNLRFGIEIYCPHK